MEPIYLNGFAIKVVNGFKVYSDKVIGLKGINMSVPRGIIYSLLGPSGCGKTTLLKSIVGVETLDSGFIHLDAESKMEIGFMPQEINLEKYLSVKEVFSYYGSLYKLSPEIFVQRTTELNAILEIDFHDQMINNLSGGQGRRVSLGISLLHDPKILILDEPTVGLDPILRDKIWNYLLSCLRTKNKTIIMSTHYIEEANQANIIGFMRNGKILKEASPISILTSYNTISLESAFLEICKENLTTKTDASTIKYLGEGTLKNSNFNTVSNNLISKHRIKTIIRKNYNVLSNDVMFYIFTFFLPLILLISLEYSIGGKLKHTNIGVTNYEVDLSSCKHTNFSGCFFNENHKHDLSCSVLNNLRSLDYEFIEYNDKDVALYSVEKTKIYAYLNFPKNFSNSFYQYIDSDKASLRDSTLFSHIDNGNFLIKFQIYTDFSWALEKTFEDALSNCNYKTELMKNINKKVLYGEKVKKVNHIFIGYLLAMSIFYYSSVGSASFMLMEKNDGLMTRSMTAGVTVFDIITSYLITHTLLNSVLIIVLMSISFIIFQYPLENPAVVIDIFFALILISWIGFFYGILCAAISRSSTEVMYLTYGAGSVQLFLGGVIWPIEAQFQIVQYISYNLPASIVGRILVNAIAKGWSLSHPLVMVDVIKTVIYLFIHIAPVVFYKYIKKNIWISHK
ncbi:ABC transporter G family member 23-like [Daktulosphaira vitifoliae]|uniref:ABC transporter G family member 23-like n=1 Tax=Daktulosphaira vitifoliae TaxID=58002 RepID=UPI0021AA0C8B|nr:ABC transporter G family member 23-like [Daktulosphaira vitifoliae]